MSTSELMYVAFVEWRYAVTMPEWPHEYTIKTWRPELFAEFESFCRIIVDNGTVEPWPPPPASPIYHNHYLVIANHKYWAMGPRGDLDLPHDMTVINRARHRPSDPPLSRKSVVRIPGGIQHGEHHAGLLSHTAYRALPWMGRRTAYRAHEPC